MKFLLFGLGLAFATSSVAYDSEFEDYDDYNIKPFPKQFMIQAVHSGKCLDVKGKSKEEGANIQQYRCKESSNQLFRAEVLIFDDAPYYSLVNIGSGRSIGIQPGTLNEKSDNVYQVKHTVYTDEEIVLWNLIKASGGDAFMIKSFNWSAGCLDIVHKEMEDRANAQVFSECHGGLNQQFRFIAVD